jgi:hypothetical protein
MSVFDWILLAVLLIQAIWIFTVEWKLKSIYVFIAYYATDHPEFKEWLDNRVTSLPRKIHRS